MRRINCYIICCLIGLCIWACEDQWDKHTGAGSAESVVSGLPVLEYIRAQPKYADFVELLGRAGMDSLLQKGMQYTLWMPSAASLKGVGKLNDSLARRWVMNHVNVTGVYASVFEPEYAVKLLSGKRVKLRADAGASVGFRIANAGITRSNIICKDGVIHELDTCLMPALNLYEKLEQDPEYSGLLKILKRNDQRVFKPELSKQTGVDDWGNLIYDSVFVFENKVLVNGDITQEDQDFTVFATPNRVLFPRLEKLYRDFEGVNGRAPSRLDSLALERWVVKALIYRDVVKNYGSREDLYSTHDELWKCSRQRVKREYEECSNGLFYEVEQLHFPVLLLMKALRNDVNDMVRKQAGTGSYSTMDTILKYELSKKGSGSSNVAISQKPSGVACNQFRGIAGKEGGKNITDFDFYLYWKSFRVAQRQSSGKLDSLVPLSVMPGEYLVKGSYAKASTYCHEDMIVYVNGKEAGRITGIKGQANGKFYNFTLGTVTIDESAGSAPVEFRFQGVPVVTGRSQRIIAPFHIELIPTENNY